FCRRRHVEARPAVVRAGAMSDTLLSGCFSSAKRSLLQQCRNAHEVVGEDSGSNPQLEALGSLGEAALHAATSEQDRDAALDAGAKTLTFLELGALLAGFPFRRFLATALWNA